MLMIDRAEPDQVPEVLRLLNDASAWLQEDGRGVGQWAYGFGPERVAPYVDHREVWLVRDTATGQAIATVRVTSDGDPDFWSEAELREPALYISKLARDREHSRPGLGGQMLRWCLDHAARLGYRIVRLDAWRTNLALQQKVYAERGWRHVRTMIAPGRNSGALFDHQAMTDPTIQLLLRPPAASHGWLNPGAQVEVHGRGHGTVLTVATPGVNAEGETTAWQTGLPGYLVNLAGGGLVVAARAEVTLASDLAEAI